MRRHSFAVAMVGVVAVAAPISLAGGNIATSAPPALFHAPMIPVPGSPIPGSGSNQLNSTSTNWSGYAATGRPFTSVTASWTEPAVTCGADPNSYSAFWVGLDGDGTSTVEQTGTDSDCRGTAPKYYAWYEMYPAFPVNLTGSVTPGDKMTATVTKSGTSFTMTIADSTKGWTKSITKSSAKAKGGSAEVITEAPSSGTGVLPLADFGNVAYTSATIDGSSLAAIGATAITMKKSGIVDSSTSALSSTGHDFSNTWKHR